MAVRDIIHAAAGVGGAVNPNTWDLDYMQFYTPEANAYDITKAKAPSWYGSFIGGSVAMTGSFFTEDGLTLFLSFAVSDTVKKYTLSQPWDVTDLTEVASFSVSTQTGNPTDIFFKPDGTKMYVMSRVAGNDGVYSYDLSTAWDITTAVVASFYNTSTQTALGNAVNFGSDGTKMFVNSTNVVYEYSLGTAWDPTTASFAQSLLLPSSETNIRSARFSLDGTKYYVTGVSTRRIQQFNLSTAWDVSTITYFGNFNPGDTSTSLNYADALSISPDGLRFFRGVYNGTSAPTGETFVQYPLTPQLTVTSQDTAPRGLFFKSDGTKVYVVGQTNDKVYEYDISTAWDLNTASYSQDFSVAAYETGPQGLFLSSDGTNMYIVGTLADNVTQYSLSTAWNISTASYVQQFYVGSQEANPYGLSFSPDGTKMFIVGITSDSVHRYDLSTPWDISTASYVQVVSVTSQDTTPTDVKFKTDGTKMYILGSTNDKIYQYDLSTAWDLTTASFEYSKFTYTWNTSKTGNPYGLYFKEDGELFFIVDIGTRVIFSYSFSPV